MAWTRRSTRWWASGDNDSVDSDVSSTIPVTGIGSMPGTDPVESARIVAGELDVPHLVELPARGPGADMIGRTLALVAAATGEFAAETTPNGWRLAGGRSGGDLGRQMRRGVSWLDEDLDHLEVQLDGFTGRVKVQVTGPWTLASQAESVRGTRLVADAGACAGLSEALGLALAEHVARIGRRIPGAQIVVQVDEPALPVVMAGHVRTPSGRGALRVPETSELVAGLAQVRKAAQDAGAAATIAHCCAQDVPFDVLRRAGFAEVSLDMALVGQGADAALGQWWDAGGVVVLGAAPSMDDPHLASEAVARSVAALWSRIGFGMADVGTRTWLSPACGLAGASPAWARSVGGLMRGAARMLESVQ